MTDWEIVAIFFTSLCSLITITALIAGSTTEVN